MGIASMGISNHRAKTVVYCLAGLISLAAVGAVRAADLRAGVDDTLSPQTFDQPTSAPATVPQDANAPSTLPAGTEPAVPPPSERMRSEPPPELTRGAEGEIVPLEEPYRGPLHFSLTALYLYGPMIGYAETPLGGGATSTNHARPRFEGLAINDAHIGDWEVGVEWDNQHVFLGGQYIHLSGDSVVAKALTSHGVTFPVHTHLHSDVRLDWYRLGYKYDFVLDTAQNGTPDFTLSPWLDVLYWDYGLSIDGGRIGQVSKNLEKFGFQLGGTVAWRPNGGPLSLEASVAGFPQSSHLANISTETLLARYRFYRFRHYDFNVLLGVEWEQQTYNDHKTATVANHITANFGPMLLAGVQVSF